MALIVGHCMRSWRKTAKQPAAGDSPLNVRPHAEVSVNENTKVTHRLGWNDVMRPNPEPHVNLVIKIHYLSHVKHVDDDDDDVIDLSKFATLRAEAQNPIQRFLGVMYGQSLHH